MHYRRAIIPGATYFFTVNLHDRKSDLLIKKIDALHYAFRKTLHHHPFSIDGIVILPDHLHIVMSLPKDDGNYSLRWNLIKGTFSKQIHPFENVTNVRKNKRERGIWQRRFWEHLIRNDEDYEHHINYIHYNPVKHGYVTNPVEWEYSSIHRYIQEGTISKDWTCNKEINILRFGEYE
jgi:putative transposase